MMQRCLNIVRTLLAGMVFALVLAVPAQAQVAISMGASGFGGGGEQNRLTSEDIAELKRILRLDEAQQAVLDDLHAAFIADAETARNELARINEAVQKEFERTNDFNVYREAGQKYASYARHMGRLRDQMLDDLKLTLSNEQLDRFDEFDRYLRRTRRLASQFPPVRGASVDLIAMVRRMTLAAEHRAMIEPMLDRYARDLDRFLLDNDPDEISRRIMGDMDDERALRSMDDPTEMAKMMERANQIMGETRKISVSIRDMNERALRQMVAVLPEDIGEQVNAEFRRRAFPEVYADTEAHAILRTVEAMTDLTDSQRSQLDEIRSHFLAEATRLNNAWAAALKSDDDKQDTGVAGGGMMMRLMGGESDLVRKIRTDRTALDARSIEQIRAILTPIQAQRLPGAEVVDWRSLGNWDG